MSPPTNQRSLQLFLGIVNHYSKFIPFLADLSAPLYRLLRKDVPFHWSEECEDSFKRIEEVLTSSEVLAHFDPKVPLGLACDASTTGIGAVLCHRYEDGTEKPIAYVPKTLTKTEQNYSQIKKDEVLSKVCEYIQKGWPAHKKNVLKEVQPYFQKQL